MLTATLMIDRNDTTCSNCRKSVSPFAKTHDINLGWGDTIRGTPGCGALFVDMMAVCYVPDMEDLYRRMKNMRPDLPIVGVL